MPHFTFIHYLAAAVGALGSGGEATPIQLVQEPSTNGIRLVVRGSARELVEARYSLEVSSSAGLSSNRSVQSGIARLLPNTAVTLLTVQLAEAQPGEWYARLRVEPLGGTAYEQAIGVR
jgi:hypothetical protein